MSAHFANLMNLTIDQLQERVAQANEVVDFIRLNNGLDVMHIVAECKQEIDEVMFVIMMKMKEQ